MKDILIACEESQRICLEFRKLGFSAFSCDLESCSGEHPEYHIQGDCLPLLNGYCTFKTMDGIEHKLEKEWDLIIAHPPCTYLTNTGNRWFNEEKYGDKARERKKLREEAANFFFAFVNAKCEHIAIENPVGYMSSHYRKPDQIIHPYQFGDPTRKATCLWLKNLPLLKPTNIVEPKIIKFANGKTDSEWHYLTINLPPKERAKVRSKTFPGIASAIADQWSAVL